MSEPEIINRNTELDIALCRLLGRAQSDYIVLYAKDEPLLFMGSPPDSLYEREMHTRLVEELNSGKAGSWATLFHARRADFIAQFKLPPDTSVKDFWPRFSFKVHRVCAGYSKYLHVAIGLIEDLAGDLAWWQMKRYRDGVHKVEFTSKAGNRYVRHNQSLPMAICEVARDMMENERKEGA